MVSLPQSIDSNLSVKQFNRSAFATLGREISILTKRDHECSRARGNHKGESMIYGKQGDQKKNLT
jgi:hypothetical protein